MSLTTFRSRKKWSLQYSSLCYCLSGLISLHKRIIFTTHTLLIINNYWSVSKTAETNASRPRPRPQVPNRSISVSRPRPRFRELQHWQSLVKTNIRIFMKILPDTSTMDKEELIKFWNSFVSGSGSRCWILQHCAFFHNLARRPYLRKNWLIFMRILSKI